MLSPPSLPSLNHSPITITTLHESFWTGFTGPVVARQQRSEGGVTVNHAGGGEIPSSGSRAWMADEGKLMFDVGHCP